MTQYPTVPEPFYTGTRMELAPDENGVLRSQVFPVLWLNPEHLWNLKGAAMLKLLAEATAL